MKFEDRVNSVDWSNFETAYGNAEGVGELLIELSLSKKKVAMDASHQLWCGLCHQHAYISSAAQPAFPFLIELLVEQDDELKIEILDILVGFSTCLNSEKNNPEIESWKLSLYNDMISTITVFRNLTTSKNENISEFAKSIIVDLET